MRTRLYVISVVLTIVLVFSYLGFRSREQATKTGDQFGQLADGVSNPASKYAISDHEVSALRAAALNGDCQAAQRLGSFHMNYTLEYDNAVKWFRIAAKCADLSPKDKVDPSVKTVFALI